MSSTNKTDLGLNQWVLSDKPTMHDFNEDNRLVDEMIAGKADAEETREVLQGKVDKADLAHPVWHDLPLINGATGVAYYAKMNGDVTLYLNFSRGSVSVGHIATLPEGVRPGRLVAIRATATNMAGAIPSIGISVKANGEIVAYYGGNDSANTWYESTIRYWAER